VLKPVDTIWFAADVPSHPAGRRTLLPRLGAATVVALIVLGQMLGSMLFDHYGWLELPKHPADWQRIVGVLLLICGAVLIRR
jgi:transporter family-2 protein